MNVFWRRPQSIEPNVFDFDCNDRLSTDRCSIFLNRISFDFFVFFLWLTRPINSSNICNVNNIGANNVITFLTLFFHVQHFLHLFCLMQYCNLYYVMHRRRRNKNKKKKILQMGRRQIIIYMNALVSVLSTA